MDAAVRARLFDATSALAHPLVRWMSISLAATLVISPALIRGLSATRAVDANLRKDLWDRYKSWLIFIPLMAGPILLGAAWVILAVGLLGLACFREFARATGMFREKIISVLVVVGIMVVTFAVFDNWYGLFVALVPLTIGAMAAATLLSDEPKGYIQRLALGIMAFLFFGVCLGHLGYFANDGNYRAILAWLVACVELNDIFAYICGKSFGRRKLAPKTSPNKTVGGAVGALILTSVVAAVLGHFVFAGTRVDAPMHLAALGVIISLGGQIGDLTLSSLKRDLGIKDWANTFPGHGGILDRFNSLLLASPAVFHYIGYLQGVGADEPARILTGLGWAGVGVGVGGGGGGGMTVERWKYQPAHDRELPPGQRLQSVQREPGLIGWIIRHVWWWLLRGYFATCQSVVVEGLENLPKAAPLILVANHQSHLDALVLACALPLKLRNHVFPIAAGDTFFRTPAARVFAAAAMNALPLWRRNAGHHAMEQLRQRLLEEPCGYILFPEGTRSRTGEMGAFRAGIGMLIAGTSVPIVPCHISGTFHALPPKRKVPRRARIRLRIGKELLATDVPNDRKGWDQIAKMLEASVRELACSA